jgi:hypothetical protein
MKLESAWWQKDELWGRFLVELRESGIYHDDILPRGLLSVRFLRPSDIYIPPDIEGSRRSRAW